VLIGLGLRITQLLISIGVVAACATPDEAIAAMPTSATAVSRLRNFIPFLSPEKYERSRKRLSFFGRLIPSFADGGLLDAGNLGPVRDFFWPVRTVADAVYSWS
jgi:hypothetical protein